MVSASPDTVHDPGFAQRYTQLLAYMQAPDPEDGNNNVWYAQGTISNQQLLELPADVGQVFVHHQEYEVIDPADGEPQLKMAQTPDGDYKFWSETYAPVLEEHHPVFLQEGPILSRVLAVMDSMGIYGCW